MLRYIKFHIDATACEHCGAGLIKGAVELSDGKKYGRDCAARAMGKKREDSAMKRYVEALRLEAIRVEQRDAYRTLTAARSGWTWIAKGYGGNCGWGSTDAYRLPDGRVVLEVTGCQTMRIIGEHDAGRVLGADWRSERMIVEMTQEEVASRPYAGFVAWTAKRWAEWEFRKGWTE
jgi:hypothetical protein